ncbi:MAG: Phosphoglycerate mutase [Pseudonocardiales bacterium]|nr:Phosphoglycerate mutase [Jatrophihabitantaceae bacterium]MCW2602352.1 Phosphoglycerate mutase [Pseudonocardiales bacterium]
MGAMELILVRHGESAGNVAREAAEAAAAEVIDVGLRDADVPLSALGQAQAQALGGWLAGQAPDQRPGMVLSSPYARAQETAALALQAAGASLPVRVDERVRDRELGVLDLLTTRGVEARFPQEAARRRWLGKFYYRPPGGESWADVALRLRSALRDLDEWAEGQRVLVVAHDAIVLLIRYICEGLDEAQILDLGRRQSVLNASVTRLSRNAGGAWRATAFNDVSHLVAVGAPITEHPADHDVAVQR